MSAAITFIDNKAIRNLEIGAGCGNFGKLYYAECYLTDSDITLKKSCKICYIDWFCDAHHLVWGEKRFDKIIICNPFGYGFRDEEDTETLMNELLRVLIGKGGQIIIIGATANPYCAPKRLKKYLSKYAEKRGLKLNVGMETINASILYPDYAFRDTLGTTINPSNKIIIEIE